MQPIATQNAPSTSIVIPHYLAGGLFLFVAACLIVIAPEAFTGHYVHPALLTITHILVLGWVSMVIFGALYQILPVITHVPLYSEKLAFASFIFLVTGTILLSIAFWNSWLEITIYIAAFLVIIAASFFVFNVFATQKQSPHKGVEMNLIKASSLWFLFTVIAGGILALNLNLVFFAPSRFELLKLHAHAGMIGWFLMLIMGVGSKLLPMFMVSHNPPVQRLRFAYYVINPGLILGLISLFMSWQSGIVLSVAMIVVGWFGFLLYLQKAFKNRVKKVFDIGMKQSALSFLILPVTFLLIILLTMGFSFQQNISVAMITAYGVSLVLGFVTSLIMGQTYKTLPFIVWLKVYRNLMGKVKVPYPKELYSEKVAYSQLWTYGAGILILLAGTLVISEGIVRIGGALFLLSVLLYNFNLFSIVLHKPRKNGTKS